MHHQKQIEYALRIGFEHFDTAAKLREMIGFCRTAGIREVQLVPVDLRRDVSVFLPRKELSARCRELTPIVKGLRKAGIQPGYCVLRTFMAASHTGRDYIGFKQPRVDMSGKAAAIHPCPLDAVYLDYIRFYYAALAGTGPTAMLTDDDFRYEYIAGMGPTCFCPLHLREFRRRYGHKVDREQLAAILEQAEPHRIKNDWMEFKRVLLVELARELRAAVHAVNPRIRLGLMLTCTEISALEGRDIRELVEAFAGGLPPLVRPGQGCYADADRLMILKGLTETVYQCGQVPPGTELQAEVDFYPHSTFNKSASFGFDFQIKANLACGLKKINIWPFGAAHKVMADHPFAGIMARNNRVFNRILNFIPDGAGMQGAQVVYSPKAAQLRRQRAQDVKMFIGPAPQILWRLGIPWTFAAAPVAVLTCDSFPMPREQALEIFERQNVFMDFPALEQALKLNLPQLAGLRIRGLAEPTDCMTEMMLADRRNAAAAGGLVPRRSGPVARIAAAAGACWRPLTRFLTRSGRPGACGMLALERQGRRCVVSAAPLGENGFWLHEVRQAQMQGVFAWLFEGVLPAAARGLPDLCPVLLRGTAAGPSVLALLNVSTARADDVTIELAAGPNAWTGRIAYIADDGRVTPFGKNDLTRRRGIIAIRLRGAAAFGPFQARFIVEPKSGI